VWLFAELTHCPIPSLGVTNCVIQYNVVLSTASYLQLIPIRECQVIDNNIRELLELGRKLARTTPDKTTKILVTQIVKELEKLVPTVN